MLVMIRVLLVVTVCVRCSKMDERMTLMEQKIRIHTLQLAYWEQDYASFKQDVTKTLEAIKLQLIGVHERVPANAETPREIKGDGNKGNPRYVSVMEAFSSEKKQNQEVKKMMTNIVATVTKQQNALNNTLSTVQNKIEHIHTRMNKFEGETSKQKLFNEHLSQKVDSIEKVTKEVGTIKNDISLINVEISDSSKSFLIESSKLDAVNNQVQTLKAVLEDEKTRRATEISQIQQHLDSQEVAFSARLDKSIEDMDAWQTVVFDYVVTNKGNGYSGSTGLFKAPRRGVYVFFTHILSSQKSIEISVQKNGKNIMYLYAAGNNPYGNDANMAVLELVENDEVKVVKHGHWGTKPFYLHHAWTTFSGFMLYTL